VGTESIPEMDRRFGQIFDGRVKMAAKSKDMRLICPASSADNENLCIDSVRN
jgi:hypothetical protein